MGIHSISDLRARDIFFFLNALLYFNNIVSKHTPMSPLRIRTTDRNFEKEKRNEQKKHTNNPNVQLLYTNVIIRVFVGWFALSNQWASIFYSRLKGSKSNSNSQTFRCTLATARTRNSAYTHTEKNSTSTALIARERREKNMATCQTC